jgi:hypothetical protein
MTALGAHVEELCARHGIIWQLGGRGRAEIRGRGSGRRRLIRTPAVRGQVSYFIALHEIGHLVGPGRSGTRLEKEAAAWRWALANSAVHPTETTRRRIGARLRSYVSWAELRQHRRRPPVLPPPASDFWRLLGYLEA